MRYYSQKINVLVTQLSMLPGIGEKTAERLAYHIIKLPSERIYALAEAITDAGEHVTYCRECFATSDEMLCPICKSKARDHSVIMVVENDEDMAQIERSGAYDGVYHVLQGAINPMGGIGPQDIRLKELMLRLRGDVKELILATSSGLEGESTATYITRLVGPTGIHITRLASGVPVGSDLSMVDSETLKKAIKGRCDV